MILTAAIYALGAVAAAATLLMIFQRDLVRSALLMLTALLATAGIYLALSAQALAALQVILYAGAVMTLFVTAIAVAPGAWKDKPQAGRLARLLGLAVPALLLTALLQATAALKLVTVSPEFSETGTLDLALNLFGPLAWQFELLSLVIVASVVGAVALAMNRRRA